jgi:predicted XRE-type DNA-binding protein
VPPTDEDSAKIAEEDARLVAGGWSTGIYADFLQLTPELEACVELRLRLAKLFRTFRKGQNLTQANLGGKLGINQSRASRLERGISGVTSIDAIVEAVVGLGATIEDIGRAVAGEDPETISGQRLGDATAS